MSEHQKPSYWAVIPADVRYNTALPANAKLLYGEISALCDRKGYCYATNSYFSELYGWSVPTIQRLLSSLRDEGYILVEIVRDRRTNEVEERRIYAGLQVGVTPPLKNEGRSPQKKGDPPLKNDFPIKEEQSNKNNSPLPPTGGQEKGLYSWPLKGGGTYEVTRADIAHYRELFPAVDIDQQFRSMTGWLEADKSRWKTRRGINRFIVSWLTRRADKISAGRKEEVNGLGKLVL